MTVPFSLSQSSLQDYVDCPRRFQLRYVDRLAYPAIESEPALENERRQREGEFFHRLVRQSLTGISSERVGKLANTPNLQRWWENFLADPNLQDLKDLGSLHAESALSAPLGNFRLLAKYDLIVMREYKALIYDWKTYRKRPRNEWLAARMQTRVYRALLVQAGASLNNGDIFEPEQIEMIYWFADFPNDPARFAYTPAQYERDWSALLGLANEIQIALQRPQDGFPLTDDEARCLYCPYRSYCERGVYAGKADEAEAELEADESFNLDFEQIGEIAF
ncbi:MAG: PD-(D/E)XK nuclease family protein [Anaerolineales bacterium]|nr:PD-(D/E)XK nuclease family protein [Anaerolineales bacterium]